MPKEIIAFPKVQMSSAYPPHDCPSDYSPCECVERRETSTKPALTVRWNGGSEADSLGLGGPHVQVTLTEYAEMSWAQWLERVGGVDKRTAERTTPDSPEEHWSANLSRADINHLIKVLRRARDVAYGRDE